MTITTTATTRALPALGGFSTGFLALDLRRVLRNRRTMVFTLLMPPLFFVIFGLQSDFKTTEVGSGNLTGYIMVSMAVYGAMLATTGGGAMVAVERSQGWSRQLRLTPLRPLAYIATKVIVAMTMGLVSIGAVFVVGAFLGAQLRPVAWVSCFVLAWICSLVFAAFGLFMGYFGVVAKFFPTYGIATLARMPFGDESAGSIAAAVANIVVWGAVFVGGSALLFRRDTDRV